ncbi:acetyl-CoA carboxylase biotin carboxyl carrier protein, partial [Flavobacteriales bacterium]|nr:acetyl-CoA carboxylase biotin carboxyl carrier protein [Flavobacteriales bacterium]
QIQQLIKFVARTGVSEVNIENSNIKINIKGNTKGENPQVVQQPVIPQIQPVQAVESVQSPPKPTATTNDNSVVTANDDSNLITIKSPIIGTFYRKPSPDKDNFVEVGDQISEGQTLCVIEAMKLFNEIESDVSGKIVKILVDDSSPVEFDQPLFLIEP